MSGVRRRILARGRVQGVFFRDTVRRAAVQRGVAGWARNRADGSVEMVFEGPTEAVDALESLVRSGPGHSDVSEVEVVEESVEGLAGFDVR
jgi:acylphosphatase